MKCLYIPIIHFTNTEVWFGFYRCSIINRIASIDAENDDDNDMSLIALIKKQKWDVIVQSIDRSSFALEVQSPLITTGKGGYNAKLSALHLVCEYNPTYEVLDALVSACPSACAYKMQPGGQLPLHVAATWKSSESVIGFLIAANPDAAKQKDWLGNLPLHCACLSGASEVIIESLLCSFPLAVNETNKQGSTPRGIVKRLSHENKNKVLMLLERTVFEIAKAKQRNMNVPGFSTENANTLESPSSDDQNWV